LIKEITGSQPVTARRRFHAVYNFKSFDRYLVYLPRRTEKTGCRSHPVRFMRRESEACRRKWKKKISR
jgi:hypothetical protein